MKMMSMKMACLMGGMGIMGYMYLKKHPEKMNQMKMMIKDTSQKIYNMMEDE